MIFRLLLILNVLGYSIVFSENNGILLRYKPRLREAVYTHYSQGESLFTNASYEKKINSDSQAYLGLRTLKTLENGFLLQKIGVSAGNIRINGKMYAHPALGKYIEYELAPWGEIPQAIGNGQQFKVNSLQLSLPEKLVSIGSTWVQTVPKAPTFPLLTEIHYEITNILGSLVIIHSRIDVEGEGVLPSMNFVLKGNSQLIFNYEEGMIIRSESTQYLEVSIKRKGINRSTKMNMNSILELQF
ncbi:MAG: hypothetical protein COB02_01255 [Candidatus Cloacimonadota bacterium]|nr:MAG: hypothetical protein COB02_01255 [Candidatus Cloacimonadota bacterium]